MADDIKRVESLNIPVGIISTHLRHIPAAMTKAYVRREQLAGEREALSQKQKPQ